MTIFLNVLFILVSVLFFSGRLYEIMFFMDTRTGFLSQGRVVSTPFMLILLFVIARCCGVIIFSGDLKQEKRQLPVGIFGILAAVILAASAVMNIMHIFKVGGFLGSDILVILGCVGLLIYAFKGIKGEKYEKIPFVLTILLPVGLCIDVALFSVSTISNTIFLMHALSYILTFVFLLLMFKYVYMHTELTTGALYVVALLDFALSAAGGLASVVGNAAIGTAVLRVRLRDTGVALLGFYALYIAFCILPEKAPAAVKSAAYKPVRAAITAEKATEINREADTTQERVYTFKKPDTEPVTEYTSAVDTDNYSQDVNRFAGRVISGLFDAKRAGEETPATDSSTGVFDMGRSSYGQNKYDAYTPSGDSYRAVTGLFDIPDTEKAKDKTVELPYKIPATDTTVDIPVIIPAPDRSEKPVERETVWGRKTVYTPDRNGRSKSSGSGKIVYKAPKK